MIIDADRQPYVIAVDAGGTHTRVGCFGIDGSALSLATGGGGGPNHNDDAAEQVTATVDRAIRSAALDPAAALALVAGVAGFGLGERPELADSFLQLPWLTGPKLMVNDSVIAHRGALVGRPGVIVVAGTGSTIFAITAAGDQLHNGNLQHYAGGARHLVFDALHRILLGEATALDDDLVGQVLRGWQVDSIAGMRQAMAKLADDDHNEVKRRYGALAPMITKAADSSPLAAAAVSALATKTANGVRLLSPLIGVDPVPVALAGSLALAPAFVSRFTAALTQDSPTITAIPAALEPLRGAALMAYELCGLDVTDAMINRLGQKPADPVAV